MPHHYSAIAIIYNPRSTGASKGNALRLAKELAGSPLSELVSIIPTDYPGHAEQLAYSLSKSSDHPLIISSSGDGGYHEVVNGALRAQEQGAVPTCGLLPSGNANDHYHNLHQRPIGEQILQGSHRFIDVLHIRSHIDSEAWERYAHSYIGIGLTPHIGHELNKVRLNRLREAAIVIRSLYHLDATKLIVKGQTQAYDSLIFSNVRRMSKVLSLSDTAKLTDGQFEIISFRTQSRLRLLQKLLKATTFGLHSTRRSDHFTFRTIEPTRIQMDGEIYQLDSNAFSEVRLFHSHLRCII